MLSKYVAIIAALLLLVFTNFLTYTYVNNSWKADWAIAEKKSAEATLTAVSEARAQEQLKIKKQEQINAEFKKERDQLQAANARADAVAGELRRQLELAVSKANRGTGEAATVAERAAAATNALVLAELLGRADRRAGELAQSAEQYRIAGLQCEAEYDAL